MDEKIRICVCGHNELHHSQFKRHDKNKKRLSNGTKVCDVKGCKCNKFIEAKCEPKKRI